MADAMARIVVRNSLFLGRAKGMIASFLEKDKVENEDEDEDEEEEE
jgi:hypothetical protein